ncbi:MAG: F0F1 ATP synthase subunit A [Pseudobutyrivibrio sp.]|nr:F0F1 ATP synthase subunit A [Pseudobutyrivibrio sp.]
MTVGILLASDGVVDMIKGLHSYEVFGQTVWITTSHVCIAIVWLSLVIFSIIANKRLKHATEVPDGFQNVLELMVSLLDGIVEGSMGKHAKVFGNWICTIFCFILVSNLSGLVGLRPPTADYGTTLALALITFVCIHVVKVRHSTAKEIWIDKCSPMPPWLPLWMPINIISDIAVPISMSLRLFANVLSGTIIMGLVYGLLGKFAIVWPAALHVYFDIFSGAIQTYVFCMLTMTYINSSYGDN